MSPVRASPLLAAMVLLAGACKEAPNASSAASQNTSEANFRPSRPSVFDSGPADLGAGEATPLLLEGEPFATSPAFGEPFFMAVEGQRLWVSDMNGDPFVHLVQLSDGRVVRSVGQRGEGPGDYQSVMDLGARPGDSGGIWAWDAQVGRLTFLSPRREDPANRMVTPSSPASRPLSFRWLTHDRLVGILAGDSSASVVLYDSTGRVERTQNFEILGDSSIPYRKRRNPSSSFRICIKPGGGGFGILFGGGGRIDRYDAQGHALQGFSVPIPSNGDFELDSLGKWQALVPRQYYRDCSSTPSRLYALFSGRLASKFPLGPGWEGEYVHVFDWDGNLERVYRLSRGAQALAVIGDSIIYAAANQTDTIYRYRISGPRH